MKTPIKQYAVLFFCHFIVVPLFLLNEINGDEDVKTEDRYFNV